MADRNEQMGEAAKNGDKAALERHINDGADIESTDGHDRTALHLAEQTQAASTCLTALVPSAEKGCSRLSTRGSAWSETTVRVVREEAP
jgi:hypothetical protein